MPDAVMELLASLPAPPFHARLADLVIDHGMNDQAQVRSMLDAANVRYICRFRDDSRVIYTDQRDWARMQPLLLEYWQREYGE